MTKKNYYYYYYYYYYLPTYESEVDNQFKHALPELDCKKGIDSVSLLMPLNIPYYTIYFPTTM